MQNVQNVQIVQKSAKKSNSAKDFEEIFKKFEVLKKILRNLKF